MGMVLVCAWCGKFMGMKDPASRPAISHGICLACSARQVWRDSPTLVVSRTRRRVAPVLEELNDHCRTQLAGYKVPRALHLVERIQRQPSGKPDYRWAKRVATEAFG